MNSSGNIINGRLDKLREQMKANGIDAYIVPSADYHQSEYVGEYFKERAYITGFTGSAGTAVITGDAAGLWTDGRYFIQAEQQLEGSGITLFKSGEAQVPTISEYLEQMLPLGGTIGFDGRTVAVSDGQGYAEIADKKDGGMKYEKDLVDLVWPDRPAISAEPAFFLEERYTGESIASKLGRVRQAMQEAEADIHILTSLDDICWLLNIRGNDVAYSPLVLCYAIVYMDRTELFINKQKLDARICQEFADNAVEILDYNSIYDAVRSFGSKNTILLDPCKLNYALYSCISRDAGRSEQMNPTTLFKAVKNETEIANIRQAHIKDGVAVTKFLYWLKTNIGETELTEMSVSEKLEEFRREQEGFIEPSFASISAYGQHAAIVHYAPTPETNAVLRPKGLLLMDTGGHYYEGSTDITRTIALGAVTEEEKEHFTIVAMGMLALARMNFLYGCAGQNLDLAARKPLWDRGLDFKHGTGHGVGYLLNIHEGPNAFRWKIGSNETVYPLEAGMITTDEPGIYIEGSHGIRTENELLTCKGEQGEYGQFMKFEYLTYVPIDRDALNPELMSEMDKAAWNAYHRVVYARISPYLTEEEREWLEQSIERI